MPTGYTAKLMEEGQSFQEFVLTCARAFGSLVMMCDDPMDAQIPERFEPTDYNTKKIDESTELLNRLKNMPNREKISFGESEKERKIKRLEKWLEKNRKENSRLIEMEKFVLAWVPPTFAHGGLKEFMLGQIKLSKNDEDYILNKITKSKKMAPMECYISILSDATRDINYHIEENKKEIERVNARNEWLRQLRLSI